jgi:hypothetical protein
MSFRFDTSDVVYTENVGFHSGNNEIKLGDSSMYRPNETAVQRFVKAGGNVIGSGSKIPTALARWLRDIQTNLFGYMLILVIVLLTTTSQYRVVRFYLLCRQNIAARADLIKIAELLQNTAT